MQVATRHCNVVWSSAASNGFLFSTLLGKLQEKLHGVTPAYSVQSLQVQKGCEKKVQGGHVTHCDLPVT